MDFEPITDTAVIEDIESARERGAYKKFFGNLINWYEENKDEFPRPQIFLNRKDSNDPFKGKKTDSLYSSLYSHLKALGLEKEWRLVKHGEKDAQNLVIVKL